MIISKLEQILSRLKDRMPQDYLLSGIMSLDGLYVAFDSKIETEDVRQLSADMAEGIKSLLQATRNMLLSGHKMLILNTENGRLLVYFMGQVCKYYCLLLLRPQANLGRAIFELEQSAADFEKYLKEIPAPADSPVDYSGNSPGRDLPSIPPFPIDLGPGIG